MTKSHIVHHLLPSSLKTFSWNSTWSSTGMMTCYMSQTQQVVASFPTHPTMKRGAELQHSSQGANFTVSISTHLRSFRTTHTMSCKTWLSNSEQCVMLNLNHPHCSCQALLCLHHRTIWKISYYIGNYSHSTISKIRRLILRYTQITVSLGAPSEELRLMVIHEQAVIALTAAIN